MTDDATVPVLAGRAAPALTRRAALALCARAPIAGAALIALGACGGGDGQSDGRAAASCVDFETMSDGERRLREAARYVAVSDDPAQTCSDCAFFTPAGEGCGQCQIFSGGPADPGGHCTSWSARSA